VKKLIILLIIGAIGWQAYGKHQQRAKQSLVDEPPAVEQRFERPVIQADRPVIEERVERPANRIEAPIASNSYRCDGRIHCSQMTSCEEATWFLRNCPGTKMDGDHDGIPCEQQWCSK